MGKIIDIRVIKRELRAKYRSVRETMSPQEKKTYDNQIEQRFLSTPMYQNAKKLLCFVSTDLEVNTFGILEQAFQDNKIVAVPKCLNARGSMKFYQIRSFDDLEKATFSLWEPKVKQCKELVDFKDALCVLPGFAFDREGYRIGFGKGYYDRFLNHYTGLKIAVCYNQCIAPNLPRGKYDVAADYVVTQKYILTIQKKENKVR